MRASSLLLVVFHATTAMAVRITHRVAGIPFSTPVRPDDTVEEARYIQQNIGTEAALGATSEAGSVTLKRWPCVTGAGLQLRARSQRWLLLANAQLRGRMHGSR